MTSTRLLVTAGVALLTSLIATPIVRALAIRMGAVAKPRADRWHRRPTALLGGIAIYVAFAIAVATTVPGAAGHPLVLAATAAFALGLVDDRVTMRPRAKLLAQVAIAVTYVAVTRPQILFPSIPVLDAAIGAAVLVWFTNAVNLLDHIDGFSSGSVAISATCLGLGLASSVGPASAAFAAATVGAALGFLAFNRSPASIFMGDGGSLFLGLVLGALALEHAAFATASRPVAIAATAAFLTVPLLDATFVSITRFLDGRPITQGGRDHTSHRLVAAGLSEPAAVRLMLGIGAVGGVVGAVALRCEPGEAMALVAGWAGVVLAFAAYLAVLAPDGALDSRPRAPFGRTAIVRRVASIAQDAALVIAAYGAAVLVRFDRDLFDPALHGQFRAFPYVAVVEVVVLQTFAPQRPRWRWAGFADAARLCSAACVAACVGGFVAWVAVGREVVLSRGVFVIDGTFLALGAVACVFSGRVFQELLIDPLRRKERVILYGPADECARLVHDLRRASEGRAHAVAMIADDDAVVGTSVAGVPVVGTPGELGRIADELGVREIALSASAASAAVADTCRRFGLRVRRG